MGPDFLVKRVDDSEILAMALANDGTLWAGSGDEILHFDGDGKHTISLPLEDSDVREIAIDGSGVVWAIDDSAHTLVKVGRDGKVHQFAVRKGEGWPLHFAVRSDGKLWYSALNQSMVLEGGWGTGQTLHLLPDDALPTYLVISATGEIWVSRNDPRQNCPHFTQRQNGGVQPKLPPLH